jgi:hypothetical protein
VLASLGPTHEVARILSEFPQSKRIHELHGSTCATQP